MATFNFINIKFCGFSTMTTINKFWIFVILTIMLSLSVNAVGDNSTDDNSTSNEIDDEESFNTGFMFFILSMIILIIVTGFVLNTMVISLLGSIGFLLFSLKIISYDLGIGLISFGVSIILFAIVLFREV